MAQDHARRRPSAVTGPRPIAGWVWFTAGLAAGIFGSFLYHVFENVPSDPEAAAIAAEPGGESRAPDAESEWDFYDIFPRSEVPVSEIYDPVAGKDRRAEPNAWLLQAGSFRNAADADSLRAALILQGMDAFVKQVDNDGVTWHRVLVGPLETSTEVDRHRRKLAEANIPSIALPIRGG